jgi:hypothetical protein
MTSHSLLDGLLQVLLGPVELLLEQADLPLQALVRAPMGLSLLGSRLGLCELGLDLFELGLEEGDLVGERGDLLVLADRLLLRLFDGSLGGLGALDRGVGFGSEGGEFLEWAEESWTAGRWGEGGEREARKGPEGSVRWSR